MAINILNTATDSDGRQVVRPATAQAGAVMYYSGPGFTCAKENSFQWSSVNPNPPFTETDRGWTTVTLYDASGVATSTETLAAYTAIDLLPTKDIELIGGSLACPNVLPVGNGDNWRLWGYAAPDVPSALGGQVPFFEDIKLNDFYEGEDIVIDGRSPKLLRYLDLSNIPAVQYGASLHHTAHTADTLDDYLTAIGYNGTQHTSGDIIVLDIDNPDTTAWLSYKHNGGSAGDATDFGAGTLDLGWFENKIRFILKHPTGLNPSVVSADVAEFQIILDAYIKW